MVISYHPMFDPFNNTDSDARFAYYGFTNSFILPMTIADGVDSIFGTLGIAQDSAIFDSMYRARKAIDSPLSITLTGKYKPGPKTGWVKVQVTNTDTVAIANHKLRYAIVETVPFAWQFADTCWYVERKMLPNANGVTISLTPGQTKPDSQSFTIDPSWVISRIRVAAFVQNDATAHTEILQGAWSLLSTFTGTDVQEPPAPVVNNFTLSQNSPNPFRGTSEIAFSLPKTESIRLAIYDIQGKLMKTLMEGTQTAGAHKATASGLESGVYFYRLEAGNTSLTRRMVVAK